MTDAIPAFLVFASMLGLLVHYWRDSRDPAFLFAGLAILAVALAFVLFWTPAPEVSAEPASLLRQTDASPRATGPFSPIPPPTPRQILRLQ